MGINSYITDIENNMKVRVDDAEGDEVGSLVVATRPLKVFNNQPFYFLTSAGSKDMNVEIVFTGTPAKIHNGLDSVLWTASGIVGSPRWDFNSAVQAYVGTHSIDATGTVGGDVSQFDRGANIDLSNYSTLTGWVYITAYSTGAGVEVYGWNTGTGMQVGNSVDMVNYTDLQLLNTWQKFAVPLTDFDLASSTIDALRMKVVKGVQNPDFYLDELQIEEVGTPTDFLVKPRAGTWLYITAFNILCVDAYDTTLVDNSMPKIPYEGFLGVPSLAAGLQVRRVQNGKILFSAVFRDLIDFLGLADMKVLGYGSDGTDSWLKLGQTLAYPVVLKAENDDKFIYTVRDNMSGLKKFWISVSCYEEIR